MLILGVLDKLTRKAYEEKLLGKSVKLLFVARQTAGWQVFSKKGALLS